MLRAKEGRKTIGFDVYEEGAVIEGLNKIRTEKLEKDECADYVSKLMLKIIQAPSKKARMGSPRSLVGTSWGEEEQRSVADNRHMAIVAERSLRRRHDEAR